MNFQIKSFIRIQTPTFLYEEVQLVIWPERALEFSKIVFLRKEGKTPSFMTSQIEV